MADVSLVIKAKAGTKTATTTVTNVNPEASDGNLYLLGTAIHALSTTTDPIITKRTDQVLTSAGGD